MRFVTARAISTASKHSSCLAAASPVLLDLNIKIIVFLVSLIALFGVVGSPQPQPRSIEMLSEGCSAAWIVRSHRDEATAL